MSWPQRARAAAVVRRLRAAAADKLAE